MDVGAGGFGAPFAVVVVVETTLLPAPCRSLEEGPVGPVEPDVCFLPDEDPGFGLGCGVVEVDVGVVVVVVGGVVAVVVTVADGVVLVDGVQLAETSVSPGGTSDAGGVPGAALTVSVVVPPVGSPTVSVQVSADALGIAPIAIVASAALTVMATVFSFRLLDTLLYLLPPRPVRN
ncbi:MAG TPA: hypothetical protein VMP89_09515 [Solirubrobacteraceae bacterium]|nr:hypothetical protein [Solirubrobacteraceae bacterium]